MREVAFNNIIIMITVYAAALVWAMQHVADKYSPKIIPAILRQVALKTFFALLLILTASGILLMPPLPHILFTTITAHLVQAPTWLGNVSALACLFIAIGITLFAGYRLAYLLADGSLIISWIRQSAPNEAVQEIFLNAVQRTDQRTARAILQIALEKASFHQAEFLDWLIEHHDLLTKDWLTKVLIHTLFKQSLDDSFIHNYRDLICFLLGKTLDSENVELAKDILHACGGALAKAVPWGWEHSGFLYYLAFTICKIGEPTSCIPRIMRVQEQLEDIKRLVFREARGIWCHIAQLKDEEAVEAFSRTLGDMMIETANEDVCEHLLTIVVNIMKDGFEYKILNLDSAEELAYHLVRLSEFYKSDKDTQNYIRGLVIDLAATLVELGRDENSIHHFLMESHLGDFNEAKASVYWLKSTSYQKVYDYIGVLYGRKVKSSDSNRVIPSSRKKNDKTLKNSTSSTADMSKSDKSLEQKQ